MLTLYYSPNACSLAPHIALKEAGVEHALVRVKGRAPAPKMAGDLASATGLAPAAGTPARYRMYEWLGYINSELHKSFSPFFAPGYSDEQKDAGRAALGRKLDFVQRSPGSGPWLDGGTFTVADAYLFTVLGWLRFIDVDLAQWPAMKAEGLIK